MASDAAIQFSKDRHHLQVSINASFQTLEICLGLRFASAASSVDSVTGALRGDTLADQVLLISREYWKGDIGNKVRVEVAIGHNDVWRPVVTVTPHEAAPTTVIFERGLDKSTELLEMIVDAVKGAV